MINQIKQFIRQIKRNSFAVVIPEIG